MTTGLILAAGFGTRLRPLTLELPKPVVPVGDRPLLAHIAQAIRDSGVAELVANAHHQSRELSSVIERLSLNIKVNVEHEIRGTAGGVAGARALLQPGAVLVWNGDVLTHAPVRDLLEQATRRDAQVLAVSPRELGAGTVGLDEHGAVVRLRGQLFGREVRSADYIGVMALGPSVVAGLPARGCLFGDVALPHLARGGRVWTVPSLAPWTDLGDLASYVAANFRWLDQQRAAGSSSDAWLAAGVTVPSAVSVQRSLLGAGTVVSGSGVVNQVIAWPGATVTAPLSRAVVLRSGRVVPFDGAAEN